MNLNIDDIIHPTDNFARKKLEAIPGFSIVIKKFLQLGYEKMIQGENLANKIKLSPTQLPEIYNILPPICEKLSIQIPEFYLEMNPTPNAYTYGDTTTSITVTSSLVEYLNGDELKAVIAHECGHILCRHVLYNTMAQCLQMGLSFSTITNSLILPVQLALLYWSRRAEFSADRVSALICESSTPIVNTMIRLAGGSKTITKNVNVDEYASQASSYDLFLESKWNKVLLFQNRAFTDHPFNSVRVREILSWVKSDTFINIINESQKPTECPNCHTKIESNWKFCRHCGIKL